MTKAIPNKHRYHSLSIILHWTMAAGVIFMLSSGLYMVYAEIEKAEQYKLFQIHKASGVVILWALLVRICVRLFTAAPKTPNAFSLKDSRKAKIGHLVLYTVLVAMPLSGWLMVSASPFGLPTFVFVDWIQWPHIPGVERNKTVQSIANYVHWISAFTLLILIVGHIGAVIWHLKKHKANLLKRMWWQPSRNKPVDN
jgi:cytochrome b561